MQDKNTKLNVYKKLFEGFIGFTLFYIAFITIFIYQTALLFSKLPNDHFLRLFFVSNTDTWILFFGSMFGGSLTLFGVLFTLIYDLKLKKEERLAQEKIEVTKNRPYIICEDIKFIDNESSEIFGVLIIKNLSNNPVRELQVNREKSFVDISSVNDRSLINYQINNHQFIGEKDKCEVLFNIAFPISTPQDDVSCHIHIEFEYYDLSGNYCFSHVVILDGNVDIALDQNNNLRFYYYNHNFDIFNNFSWTI